MNSAALQYLRKVNKRITCPNVLKKPFLQQLKNEIQVYCVSHEDADLDTLTAQFGVPEEIAAEFLSEMGEQSINRCMRTRKKLLFFSLGITVFTITLAVFLGMQTNNLQQELPQGEYVATITYERENRRNTSCLPTQNTIFESDQEGIPLVGE